MTDDDYDEYEYEYEYSDNDDEYESDNDDAMMCGISHPSSEMTTTTTEESKNANPNSPPSPTNTTPSRRGIRKNPSWQTDHSQDHPHHHSHDAPRRRHDNNNTTMSAQELVPLMERRISDICEALGIPTPAAAPLLRQHKWNTQRVLESFMSDSERTLQKAGVTHRCNANPTTTTVVTATECSICMEDMDATNSLSMPCGHAFCLDCWQDFLTNAIQMEGATCMTATCPEAACTEIVTDREVQTACPSDSSLLDKYQQYQLRHFVEANGRWCPGKGCDRVAIPCAKDDIADCDKCGTQFCMGCSEEPHSPVNCQNLVKWQEKSADESETVNWMTVNTKNCPKCFSRIEKNGGCMYVTCRKCRHGFCWVCMGDHHVWQCNAYKDPEQDGKLRAKNELERYLHYYTRFQGHSDAQKFARKQLDKKVMKQREEEDKDEQKKASAAKDGGDDGTKKQDESVDEKKGTKTSSCNPDNEVDLPDFVKDANQQLVHCRRVLKYTYVFAYYHFEDPKRKQQKECFEFHQGTLEGLTERLSKATEKALDDMDQQDVVNQTRAIGEFIKNVLAHVDDGMDDEYS